MGGRKDLITAGLTLGALADAAKAKGKMSAIIATESGAVASFPDGTDAPVADLTAAIVPVQSGSGDPSPTNIRPISGWTECNVTRAGKNVLHDLPSKSAYGITFEYDSTEKFYHVYGTCTTTVAISYMIGDSSHYIENTLYPGIEYVFSCNGAPSEVAYIRYEVIYMDGTSEQFLTNTPFVLQKESKQQRVRWTRSGGSSMTFYNGTTYDIKLYPQLELGSAATSYEPYRGNIYNISFGSAGTVYGGTLDVTTGTLTVEKAVKVFSGKASEAWYKSDYNYFICARIADAVNSNASPDTFMSNLYKYGNIENTTSNLGGCLIWQQIRVRLSDMSGTADDWKASLALQPLQVVYTLAEPLVYNLTPVEIRTLVGQNTIWADTGDVTVKYTEDTKAFIDKYIAERRNG